MRPALLEAIRRRSASYGRRLYFDSAAAGGGDGTSAAPYNDLTAIAALSGDQQGLICYLKRGSEFVEILAIGAGVTNLTIDAYGSGADPIVTAYTPIDSANWVDYTGTQADTYYMTAADYGATNIALTLDDNPCHYRNSIADLLLTYEQASSPLETWPWTYFYDSGTSRMYVHTDGTDPTTMVTKRAITSQTYAISCASPVTVKNVIARGGKGSVVFATLPSDVGGAYFENVHASAPSNDGSSASDVWNIIGPSRAAKAPNVTLKNCVGVHAYGPSGNANNSLELSFLERVTVEGGMFGDCKGNSMETWKSCDFVIFTRGKLTTSANCVRVYNSDGDNLTNNEDWLFVNMIFFGRKSYSYQGSSGTGSQAGSRGFTLSPYHATTSFAAHTNWRVINCTFSLDDADAVYQYYTGGAYGAGDNSLRFRNNLVLLRQSQAFASYEPAIYLSHSAVAAQAVMDRNCYQFGRDGRKWMPVGSPVTSLAAYKTAWDAVVAANEDNSISPDAATQIVISDGTQYASDLTPSIGSPLIGLADTTDPDYPSVDFYGNPRTRHSIGAID